VKIIAYDHNRNHMLEWAKVLLADETVAPAIFGFAHHWYEGGEGKNYATLDEFHRLYANKPLLATEQGFFAPLLNSPLPAELYALDLIGNMNHHTAAWIVWGLTFDVNGGPNHARNFNHSPIMLDVERNQIHYNPSYYYLAQVSKFVRPGAVRVGVVNNESRLRTTAFATPYGEIVTLILNNTDQDRPIELIVGSRQASTIIKARTFTTFVNRP
jgi:glucosylceramidase